MTPWWQGRMCAFDLETTSPQPEEARIVSAAIAFCGGGEPTETRTWLADPGVEIPEEASAVHGITTERARAEGRPAGDVVAEVTEVLTIACAGGLPLVIANARYDLTVADREARRHAVARLSARQIDVLVVDPFVIDKRIDQYRPSYGRGISPEQGRARGLVSTRTLEGMCGVYNATLEGAHDASFDAIAAARIAYQLGRIGKVGWRRDRREVAKLTAEWESVRHDLPALHAAQKRWALEERPRFAEYKRSIGDFEIADRVMAERGWPVLEVMDHEEWTR